MRRIMEIAGLDTADKFDIMSFDHLVKSFIIADNSAAVKHCLSPLQITEGSSACNTIYFKKRELTPLSPHAQLFHSLSSKGNIVLNIGNNNSANSKRSNIEVVLMNCQVIHDQ